MAFIAIAITSYSQAPQGFNYQAILRNSDGTVKANENVAIQVSIIHGYTDGPPVYMEIHNTTTSEFGMVNLVIGEGESSDKLSFVDWANGPYYLDIIVNGAALGSSPLLSVPYALYAASGNEGAQGPPGIQGEDGPQGVIGPIGPQGEPGDTKWAEASGGINYADGRVGIGTTTPSEKLDVDGNVNISGNLTVKGQILAGEKELELKDIFMALGLPANYSGTVVDVGGNSYKTIKIGSQAWFAENLKTWHYTDGSLINRAYDINDFDRLTSESSGALIQLKDWNNQASEEYGLVYNKFAVISDKNLCPDGWHVASKADWNALVEYLGGSEVAGGKLKEAGYSHWPHCYLRNVPSSNESGFTAIPGGFIDYDAWPSTGVGVTAPGSEWAAWWYGDQTPSRFQILSTCSNKSNEPLPEGYPIGAPVRCVKD